MYVKEMCLAGRMNHRKEIYSGFERIKKHIHVFQRATQSLCFVSLINLLLDVVWDSGKRTSALLDLEPLSAAGLTKGIDVLPSHTYPAILEPLYRRNVPASAKII